jgi:serine/threonine-protein kinase
MPAGYEFVRKLGSGANGWVALALHGALARPVAIKFLFGGREDDEGRRRLEREGQALARLNDPHVVRVFELIDAGADLALVMEYVEGGDLSQVLPSLAQGARLRVLIDVAGALAHVGAYGIVHRDIKPSNVLIDSAGGAKLTDFGIARMSRSASAFRTEGGGASGTPRYVAPEQLNEPDHESPAADAYSFAVMTYELIVNESPFRATSMEGLIYAHLAVPPVDPRAFGVHLDDATACALLAGLSKVPSERPSPTELIATVAADSHLDPPMAPRATAAHVPVPAWEKSRSTQPRTPSRRSVAALAAGVPPLVVGALMALVVVVLLIVVLR